MFSEFCNIIPAVVGLIKSYESSSVAFVVPVTVIVLRLIVESSPMKAIPME